MSFEGKSLLEDVLDKNIKGIVIYTNPKTFLDIIFYKYCEYLLAKGPFFLFLTNIILKSESQRRVVLPKSILELIFVYYEKAVNNQEFILMYRLGKELEKATGSAPHIPFNFISWTSYPYKDHKVHYYGYDCGLPYSI